MEEKLAKLGVERGSGFMPGHSRPASVSVTDTRFVLALTTCSPHVPPGYRPSPLPQPDILPSRPGTAFIQAQQATSTTQS